MSAESRHFGVVQKEDLSHGVDLVLTVDGAQVQRRPYLTRDFGSKGRAEEAAREDGAIFIGGRWSPHTHQRGA